MVNPIIKGYRPECNRPGGYEGKGGEMKSIKIMVAATEKAINEDPNTIYNLMMGIVSAEEARGCKNMLERFGIVARKMFLLGYRQGLTDAGEV